MADDTELTLTAPMAARKRQLIRLGILVVLLLTGSIGGWLIWSGSGGDASPAASDEAAGSAAQVSQPALYVGLPRPFVFNAVGASRDRLVQIKIQLMVRGQADETLAKQNIPLIEGTLLRVFSAASAEQLMTFEGKEQLRQEALAECRRVLGELVNSPVIEQVLFTGFVMQ